MAEKNKSEKHTTEKFDITVDFSQVLSGGDYITTGSYVSSSQTTQGMNTNSIVASYTNGTSTVVGTVESGSLNSTYKVTYQALTYSGSTYVKNIYVKIRE